MVAFFLFLDQDGCEVSPREGSVSVVELLSSFRGGFLGVLFLPFFGIQSVDHSLEAKHEFSNRLCFATHPLHTTSSWCWHMLVRMLQ